MTKTYTTLLLLLLFPCILFSQSDDKYACFGLRLGLGTSTLAGLDRRASLPVDDMRDISVGYRFSWDVGVSVQFGWGEGYVAQTDLMAGMQGATLSGVYMDGADVDRLSISNMQLAVTVGKKVHISEKVRFIITAGPYLGYDLTSEGSSYSYGDDTGIWDDGYDMTRTTKTTKSAQTRSVTLDTDNYDIFRQTDFGVTFIAGIETGGLQIAFSPQFGLTNLAYHSPKVSHRVYKLAMTYYF